MIKFLSEDKTVADRVRYEAHRMATTEGPIDLPVSGEDKYVEQNQQGLFDKYYRLYRQSAPLRFAIDLRAKQLASLPVSMVDVAPDGTTTPVESHSFLDLMAWINPAMTTYDFIEALSSYYDLTNRWAFCIEETPDRWASKNAVSLYPLNPQWLEAVVSKEYGVIGYYYRTPSHLSSSFSDQDITSVFLSVSQVVCSTGFDPQQSTRGISVLDSLTEDLQTAQMARRQQTNWFTSMAHIGGVITTESDNPDEIAKVRRDVKTMGGVKNAYKLLVLGPNMKFEQFGRADTGQTAGSTKITEVDKQIMQAYGVYSGLYTGESQGSKKLIEQLSQLFFLHIMPNAVKFEQRVTKDLIGRFFNERTYGMRFQMKNVPALQVYDLDNARVLVAKVLAGIITPNEARRLNNTPDFALMLDTSLKEALGEAVAMALEKYGDTPRPVLNIIAGAQQGDGTSATPSLDLTGTSGGRNQSSDGEAQMLDGTGTKEYTPINSYDEEDYYRIKNILAIDKMKIIL